MSKKIISILLILILILSLCACGKQSTVATPDNNQSTQTGSVVDKPTTEQNQNDKEDVPYGNYTNSFHFTGSDDDFESDKYKNANFKNLFMSTEFAYGIQEITISNSLINKNLNNSVTELTFEINKGKKNDSLIRKIVNYQNFVKYYSAEYEFERELIPISSKIKIRPYNVTKQGENRAQKTIINYTNSKLYCLSDYFSSMTFQYNHSMIIENQKGNFLFTFEKTSDEENVLAFGGKTKSITISGTSDIKSNLTATYKDGIITIESDNPDFCITELVIVSEDGNGSSYTQNDYKVTENTKFIIKPIEDLKVEITKN